MKKTLRTIIKSVKLLDSDLGEELETELKRSNFLDHQCIHPAHIPCEVVEGLDEMRWHFEDMVEAPGPGLEATYNFIRNLKKTHHEYCDQCVDYDEEE